MCDIDGLELLLVVGSEVIGSMPVTVISAALDGSIFEDTCCY